MTDEHQLGIRSCRPLLSGRDLLYHHVTNFEPHTHLNRLVYPEEELAHQDQIIQVKEEFRQLLSQQRVGKEDCYSMGEWDNEKKRVKVIKALGKYFVFGYVEDRTIFLNGYEALHLMEMNRLIVYWSSVIVSMEQAYMLFLGYPDSLDLEEYLVYSALMRAGFYLLKYDANRDYQSDINPCKELDKDQKYVWRNLYDMLKQPNPLTDETDKTTDLQKYNTIRHSMLSLGDRIMSQTKSDEFEQSMAKRKRVNETDTQPNSQEDKVRFESKHERFSALFQSFNVIKSTLDNPAINISKESADNQLKFSFDMFHADGSDFRKSCPPAPEHRILVRRSNQMLPTAAQIRHLFDCQPKPAVPILLMRVADTLSIHCFLYNFNQLPANPVALTYSSGLVSAATPEMETDDELYKCQ